MTHSMRKSTGETGDVFTIGIWTGSGWNSVRDFDDGGDAAAFCNYLNGGDGKQWHPPSTMGAPAPAPAPEPEADEPESAPAEEPPAFEPEPWETAPRPSVSAAAASRKRPKR